MANEENTEKNAVPFLLSLILLVISILATWFIVENTGRDEDAEFMDEMEGGVSRVSYLRG